MRPNFAAQVHAARKPWPNLSRTLATLPRAADAARAGELREHASPSPYPSPNPNQVREGASLAASGLYGSERVMLVSPQPAGELAADH